MNTKIGNIKKAYSASVAWPTIVMGIILILLFLPVVVFFLGTLTYYAFFFLFFYIYYLLFLCKIIIENTMLSFGV